MGDKEIVNSIVKEVKELLNKADSFSYLVGILELTKEMCVHRFIEGLDKKA